MKKVILVVAMVFATGSFVNANDSKNEIKKQEIIENVPCYTVYTVCDRASGDSYNKFDSCMQNNDC
ncbi:hypothetical protein [Tenacibaculum finnmarkense]|uniref:Kazal-like domain-containing protein n=1 Tax=Tenacibaculum finnmarkense genomovar finnmarkense TaxID=1458503 RepID=A0AAP1WH01_9FLAO|nr:hypothetical protein [Tenacibaculum finnmarkense]MBE7645322.1 hypothetical protein [Tenacibaculum finnmarkense genomovar ulcerans]MBE7653613.1 hypothetical protein [Tenacibaculum finnmarkense genomovar finnmarkense]MBE7660213.1 hypothetical protein [Tenacibaculum finnmarkense genomovar finnmarkense]MBE7687242.1 hypothetical protein [Tenacibaculum finnmarkense genomovar ulcerans]MBE7695917.1 hypothetical protein [Tenacibaculum finnmarkense genomovar finnmarkense]